MYKSILTIILLASGMSANAQQSEAYLERVDSADTYIARQRWTDAERVLKDAMRMEPGNINNSLLLSNLGIVQHRQGKLDEAIENFTIGLAMTPNSFILLKNRAAAFLDSDKEKEAYDDLTKALDIDKTDSWVLNSHGLLSLQFSHRETAERDFKWLLDVDSKSKEALIGLALCANINGDLKTAIDYYSEVIDNHKEAEYYVERALLYIYTGDLNKADEDIREGIRLNQRLGNLYLIRAYLNKLRYRNEDAEIDKKIAIDYDAEPQLLQLLFPDEEKK